jgi:hypothetical protein
MDVDDDESLPYMEDFYNIDSAKGIMITSHGAIITKKNEQTQLFEPKLITIPDNIEVVKITVTAPGVVNFGSEYKIYRYYQHIMEIFDQLKDPNIPVLDLQQMLNELITKFQREYEGVIFRPEEYSHYARDFKRHSDRAFQVYYLNPGSSIIDKEYSRNPSNPIENSSTSILYKIIELPNEFDLLYGHKNSITTEEIIHYYSQIGTPRLFIFDFSCSTCTSGSMTPRDIRHLRQTILCDQTNCDGKISRTHAYGGTRRNRNKKNKQNKYKKQLKKRLLTRKK